MAASRRPGEADRLLHQALEMQRASLGADHPYVADTLLALSALDRARRNPSAAEPMAVEAVAIRRAKLPQGHWKRAMAEAELASVLIALGRHAEAQSLLSSAQRVLVTGLGADDPRVAQVRALLKSAGHG